MYAFPNTLAFFLLVLGLSSLPWTAAIPACDSEWRCAFSGRSPDVDFSKRLEGSEPLRKRVPWVPPIARHPRSSPVPKTPWEGVIQVFSGSTSLGFVAPDPHYWTPLLTSDINSALLVSFELDQGKFSGSQLAFIQKNDSRAPLFGLVVGRDSTSSEIGPGNFNYLYLDPMATPGTPPGSTPQSVPSFFSTQSGLDKQAESSVWSVNLDSLALSVEWINADNRAPSTVTFIQSNHLYAGGDADAFHSRYSAPVIPVTLKFTFLS